MDFVRLITAALLGPTAIAVSRGYQSLAVKRRNTVTETPEWTHSPFFTDLPGSFTKRLKENAAQSETVKLSERF
jgi:hypothetical protein